MMMANLASELIRHGRIHTTLAKAKTVQPLAERMITFGKRGDVAARRQVLRVIRDRDVVHKLFSDVGPAFAQRDGGYTRVLRLGPRKGDAAEMAFIELVEGVSVQGDGDLAEQPRRRWSLRRRRGSTLSTTARESAEDRQAAVDRGEDVDGVADEEDLVVDEPSTGGDQGDQADPAEVEARLAADDEALDEVEDVITDPDLDPDQQVEAVEDIVEEREDRSDEGR
jgi:large subunit ribosomal protein L17